MVAGTPTPIPTPKAVLLDSFCSPIALLPDEEELESCEGSDDATVDCDGGDVVDVMNVLDEGIGAGVDDLLSPAF